MALSNRNDLMFERLKPGRLTLWGSAAWKQTQLTPGVSTHAAPFPNVCRPRTWRTRERWVGILEAAVMLGGVAGLIGGLHLLEISSFPAVVTMLASLTLVLVSVARASAAQETQARRRCGRREYLTPRRRQGYRTLITIKPHDKEL